MNNNLFHNILESTSQPTPEGYFFSPMFGCYDITNELSRLITSRDQHGGEDKRFTIRLMTVLYDKKSTW